LQGSVAVGQAAGDTPIALQPTVGQTVAPQATTVTPTTLQPPGRKRPPVALIAGGIAALVVIAVVAVVIASSSSSSSPGGPDPKKEVETAAVNFMAASGASTCDLVTPAFIARNYKGLADCRKQFSTANSESIAGPQAIGVTGTRATDAFNIASGHHYSLVLVKQNAKWLVDDSSDDTQDAQNAADDYIKAKGSAVCGLVTERLKAQSFGGAACETVSAKYRPDKPSGDKVTATSTRATDNLSIGGKQATLTLVKTNGTWLVDRDSTFK
jgi:hypothetical protein